MGRGPWPGTKKQFYDTLDARCAACRIYGGKEDPCLNEGILAQIRKREQRPCPRVDLRGENIIAGRIAMLCVGRSPVAEELLRLTIRQRTRLMHPEERIELLERVYYALGHKDVTKHIPDPTAAIVGSLFASKASKR